MTTPADVIDAGPLAIPRSELTYRATRAGGPGGQHVNTSSTRVELTWDVARSASLTDEQRERLLARLARRIDSSGVLRMTDATTRSQHRNRERVTERFAGIVAGAFVEPKKRKPTKPSRAAKQARLEEKRKRGETKKLRGPVQPE
ncbi:MAG TPA: alternative ribosome rescue aminoacyl-tRNA hydrolase ArfB [Longimicrobiales bacterium]